MEPVHFAATNIIVVNFSITDYRANLIKLSFMSMRVNIILLWY